MSMRQPHRTRTLWLTGMLHSFTHLYGVALLPLYLGIQQDLRLSGVEQATLLVTVMGAAYFLPSYPLGILADRFSRKKLLALGLAINALGFASLSVAPNYAWALASVTVAGLGGSFYHPAATALIARSFPEARGRALGLVGIGASAGFFLGPLYCGWRFVDAGSWRVPIREIALLGFVAAAVFAWLAEEEPDSSDEPAPAPAPAPATPVGIFPTAGLWFFFLAASFAFSLRDFAGSAVGTSASLFFQNAHGFSPWVTGQALSGVFLMSAVSNPLFGHLSDRGRMRWIVVVLGLAAVLISIFPRLGVPWMFPAFLGYGFFFMASYPITEAALMESVPDAVRGRVFGLFITIGGLLGNLSHWFVGDWVEKLGPRATSPSSYTLLYASMAFMIVLSLAALPFLHVIRKREHLARAAVPAPPLSGLH